MVWMGWGEYDNIWSRKWLWKIRRKCFSGMYREESLIDVWCDLGSKVKINGCEKCL